MSFLDIFTGNPIARLTRGRILVYCGNMAHSCDGIREKDVEYYRDKFHSCCRASLVYSGLLPEGNQ